MAIKRTQLTKILTREELGQSLLQIKEHCVELHKFMNNKNYNTCELCWLKPFCYEQFCQDMPKDWDLKYLLKHKD